MLQANSAARRTAIVMNFISQTKVVGVALVEETLINTCLNALSGIRSKLDLVELFEIQIQTAGKISDPDNQRWLFPFFCTSTTFYRARKKNRIAVLSKSLAD